MNFMNDNANIKQFQMIKFINENCDDDHIISKILIMLRRDKIEAPYYIISKNRLSSCIDKPDNGVIHVMDILNHVRRHNLTEGTYNEIKSLIVDNDFESDQVKISNNDKHLKMILMSKNEDEFETIFKQYNELFDKIDNLVE